MSEKYAGSYLHYSIDTETYLLRKTRKDRLSLPVVNLDKASICSDRKTSFSFWQKRKIGIRREGIKGGTISGGLCQIGRDHMYAFRRSRPWVSGSPSTFIVPSAALKKRGYVHNSVCPSIILKHFTVGALWVPCGCNSSYSCPPIVLKLCRYVWDGMKMCIWFGYNPLIIFSLWT